MSDNNLESGQPASSQAPGQGQGAGAVGGQPTSNSQDVPQAVRDYIDRSLQSWKDRRIDKIEKRQDAQDERYFQLRQKGLSPDEARREMAIDELISERSQPTAASPASRAAASETQSTDLKPTELFELFGLENDRGAIELALEYAGKPVAMKAALVDYAHSQKRAKSNANPASIVAPNTGTVSANEKTALLQQFEQEKSKISVRGPRAADALIELKRKYRQQGLEV